MSTTPTYVPEASASMFHRVTSPVLNLCDALGHLTSATKIICRTAEKGAELVEAMSLESLRQQHELLLARKQAHQTIAIS